MVRSLKSLDHLGLLSIDGWLHSRWNQKAVCAKNILSSEHFFIHVADELRLSTVLRMRMKYLRSTPPAGETRHSTVDRLLLRRSGLDDYYSAYSTAGLLRLFTCAACKPLRGFPDFNGQGHPSGIQTNVLVVLEGRACTRGV